MDSRKHYFFVTGEIVFKADEDDTDVARINGVFVQDDRDLNSVSLGKAQQAVQMAFHKQMSELVAMPPDVIAAVLLNIQHLGHFTQDEWTPPAQ